jgi:hypothetical protein
MKWNWKQRTAVLSAFALALVFAGCDAKREESSSRSLAEPPQSMAQPERRDAPVLPPPQGEERPGATSQEKSEGRAG